METIANLDDQTIKQINGLVQINTDSVHGFHEAAEEIQEPRLQSLFLDLAKDRMGFADELKKYVKLNDTEPKDEGSYAASVHQTWLKVRELFSSNDTHAILAEAERGEDHIKAAYEEALKKTAGSPLNSVLTQQYAKVKAGHDKIRDLRDANK